MSRKSQSNRRDKHRRGADNPQDDDGTAEILDVLRLQSEYIDQIEKENKTLKDELFAFRTRLEGVVRENQSLHDNIRSNVVQETISKASLLAEENQREYIEQHERELSEKYHSLHESHLTRNSPRSETLKQWTQEMKNVKAIYEAKIGGYEAEVETSKKDLENALKDSAELRERIRTLESLLKTPKYDANNPSFSHLQNGEIALNANAPLIERLTKERDELMKSVASMRNSVTDAQKTESALRREIQKGMALVEDTQLEKSQLKTENDRLKKDLKLTRQRLEDEITSAQNRMAEVAAQQRKACREEINDLAKKVGELTTISSMYEDSIQSAAKEKASLCEQLQESKRQLLTANEDLGRMRSEIEYEVRSALKGYKGAEDELRNTKLKLQEELSRTKQERVRLEQEASDQQRRLQAAQADALASKELNVTLTKQCNDALSKLQKAKDAGYRTEQDLKESLRDLQLRAEEKETRLEDIIRKSSIEYQQRLSELENISSKQANLIGKLRDEGKLMDAELTRVTKKYRKEIGILSQDKDNATARLNRLIIANKDLEEQVVQHGITHREMQVRLRQLDERTRRTTGYAADVVEENDKLNLDKSALLREVEFLQCQVMSEG